MSIILEGIDMPTDRKPYAIEVTYRFEGADGLFSEKIYLSPNQAIQIPKKHGRIVDLEKLKEEFAMKNNICKECASFKECDNKTFSKSEICEKFIWVPTILEAEENR